jgi:hypothetical protein
MQFLGDAENDILDPDTDEVLLGLLARDAEQPPLHDRPHRRWVTPPHSALDGDGGNTFRQVKPGWWRVETQEEQRELAKGRSMLERERHARAKAWQQQQTPSPYQRQTWRYDEPLDRFVQNLRANPASRMPDWLIEDLRRNGELWPPASPG